MDVQGKSAALVAITAALTISAGLYAVDNAQHPQVRAQVVDNSSVVPDTTLIEVRDLKRASRSRAVSTPKDAKAKVINEPVVTVAPRSKPAPKARTFKKEHVFVSRGTYKAYALSLVGEDQFRCLEPLWEHESGWRTDATNPRGSAWGIPQALPGSKMASEGADWRTNGRTQIRWGVKYIAGRYGNSCAAWAHFQSHNWY